VEKIKPFVDFVTHCPEVEIGLGAPRKFVRIVLNGDIKTFVQPATNGDFTQEMSDYIKKTVPKLQNLDGFILKENSPSCSMSRVRYYRGSEKDAEIGGGGPGLFGEAILGRYGHLPIESDGRLRNQKIREVFLTRIFTLAAAKQVLESKKMGDLVEFHTNNKYLLMTFSQKRLRELGRITSNPDRVQFDEVAERYLEILEKALAVTPKSSMVVNVFSKIYGYFSKNLKADERKFFLSRLDSYRQGKLSITSLRETLLLWALRFEQDYILKQTVFQPFPQELNEICKLVQYQKE
jgi:uncharacterized protein YbgA (DUF1722 family)/uncharacterized protein YbbK (DUF523 family)